MSITTGELAKKLSLEIRGRDNIELTQVTSLEKAGSDSLSFVANPHFLPKLASTSAAAVIVKPEYVDSCPCVAFVSDNPYLAYARAAQLIYPVPSVIPGIAPSAEIATDAQISPSASIAAFVSIGRRAVIGDHVSIGAGSVIGDDVVIGQASRLEPRVVIHHAVAVGERCHLYSGVVVGGDGFGLANDKGKWVKIPQIGSVVIGNDVDIGSNTTVDRGAIDNTIIGDGVKLDNLIQIAHNVSIGEHTAIAACTAIAGSAKIGNYCIIGGSVNIVGHLEITDRTTITGQTFVANNIRKAGVYSSGVPLQENSAWRRNYVRFKQLDELSKRIKNLEKLNVENKSSKENEE